MKQGRTKTSFCLRPSPLYFYFYFIQYFLLFLLFFPSPYFYRGGPRRGHLLHFQLLHLLLIWLEVLLSFLILMVSLLTLPFLLGLLLLFTLLLLFVFMRFFRCRLLNILLLGRGCRLPSFFHNFRPIFWTFCSFGLSHFCSFLASDWLWMWLCLLHRKRIRKMFSALTGSAETTSTFNNNINETASTGQNIGYRHKILPVHSEPNFNITCGNSGLTVYKWHIIYLSTFWEEKANVVIGIGVHHLGLL